MKRSLASLMLIVALLAMLLSSGSTVSAQSNTRVLRLATTVPHTDPNVIVIDRVVNKVLKEKTGGALQIQVYADGQLGSNATSIQGVETGTVDFDIPGSSFLSGIVPQIQAFELPFLFGSPAQAYASIAEGPAGKAVNKQIAAKGLMENLAWWEIGERDFVNNKRPVHSPADLKGIKMRTLPSPIQIEIWKTLGAEPVPMDPNEVFSALSQGTIDGLENILSIVYGSKYYEVLKYVTLTDHVITTTPVLASTKTMKSLTPEQQLALREAFHEATSAEWKLVQDGYRESVADLKKAGLKVDEHPDIAAFRKAVTPVYADYRKKYGSDVLDEILASNAAYEKAKH